MRKLLLGATALILIATSAPGITQQSSVKPGTLWTSSRIDVKEGQFENYMDYLTKVWIPSQEFAKSQGWITEYHILNTMNAREGEPDIILVTRFNDFPSAAEMERRDAIMNERMKQDDHSSDAAFGQRGSMRQMLGSITYREVVKR